MNCNDAIVRMKRRLFVAKWLEDAGIDAGIDAGRTPVIGSG